MTIRQGDYGAIENPLPSLFSSLETLAAVVRFGRGEDSRFLFPHPFRLLPAFLSLLSFLMKFRVFHDLEFSLTIFAIALCNLSPILPNSHHLQFHGRCASFTPMDHFLHRDLFWVSILAPLELKSYFSVKSVTPPII
jgi:hypothetical protein